MVSLQSRQGAVSERSRVVMDPEFVKRLACPACKVALRLEGEELVCTACRRRFPVRDGVPVLLLDEAAEPEGP